MEYTKDDIYQQVKDQIDIVDLVSEYVSLQKKSSNNYFGICPFHHEKTPSFSVSATKQIYYCFGCHKGGDCVAFIRDIEHLEWKEALEFLAKRLHIDWQASSSRRNTKEQEHYQEQKRQFLLANSAAKFYYAALRSPAAAEMVNYLRTRELSATACGNYGLGAALDQRDLLVKYLQKSGFSEKEMLASGLVRIKNNSLYDLFRRRLIFPIMDRYGRVIAFGGRVLDDSKPKYINSPETPIYTKGEHLYAYNFAKKFNAPEILVVEGYMDAISLLSRGYHNVVACLGTALTHKQVRLLKLLDRQVIMCLDSDAAGQKATYLSLQRLELQGLSPKVLKVKQAKDPDEFVKKFGIEAFNNLILQAEPALNWRLNTAFAQAEQADGSFDESVFFQAAIRILAAINSPLEYARALKEVCKLVASYDESTIADEVKYYKNTQEFQQYQRSLRYETREMERPEAAKVILPEVKQQPPVNEPSMVIPPAFVNILWLLCNDNSLYQNFAAAIDNCLQNVKEIQALWLQCRQALMKNTFDAPTLLNILSNSAVSLKDKDQITRLFLQESSIKDSKLSQESLSHNLSELQRYELKRRINYISWRLRNDDFSSEAEKDKLRQQYQSLSRKFWELKR